MERFQAEMTYFQAEMERFRAEMTYFQAEMERFRAEKSLRVTRMNATLSASESARAPKRCLFHRLWVIGMRVFWSIKVWIFI
ncbi:MAG: hypothetical protein LBD79_04005 [Treponema sp.]|nr:hypothetical protein [Treponema sp.]